MKGRKNKMNQVTDQQIIGDYWRKRGRSGFGVYRTGSCALACAKCKEVLGNVPSVWMCWLVEIFIRTAWGLVFREQEWFGLPIGCGFRELFGKSGIRVGVLKGESGDNLQRAKIC